MNSPSRPVLRWLGLIDKLESLLWCIHKAPDEYARAAAKWQPARAWLIAILKAYQAQLAEAKP